MTMPSFGWRAQIQLPHNHEMQVVNWKNVGERYDAAKSS